MGNEKIISELLTAVLVLITGFYAWATYKILRANEQVVKVMHEQAEAMTRPYITIAPVLEPDNPIFYLRISNTGKTPAYNLKLSLDKSFYKFGRKKDENNLCEHPAFKQVITSFPPSAEIVFSLAQSFVIFGKDVDSDIAPSSFTVTAEYSYKGNPLKEVNLIDLTPYLGTNIPQDPCVRKLKDINNSIEKVAAKIEKKS